MKRILLIEDDNVLRENTKELLEIANYDVIDVSNGKIGLETALNENIDLILCDIIMPELDGYGVLEALNSNSHTRNIPFIFISAKNDIRDIRKGMALGADDYIPKPYTENDLIDSIESRLAKHEILWENQISGKSQLGAPESKISDLDSLQRYILDFGEYKRVSKKKDIYREKKKASHVYYIKKGLVKLHTMDEGGKELILDIHKSNEFFGFCSLNNSTSYLETATALETCELYSLKADVFKKLLEQNHRLTLELINVLSDKVSSLKYHLLQMAYASVLQKTINTLLKFAEKLEGNTSRLVTISRTDLASIAGISTESFIRCLTQLRNEGLIEVEGRLITILNLPKLRDIKALN